MTPAASLAGSLLVATPALEDEHFLRAVVLLLEHDESGALGVVVNRPTEVPVNAVLPSWEEVVSAPDVVFQGGPVSLDSALALAALPVGEPPEGVRPLHPGVGIVEMQSPPAGLAGGLLACRVFAGYAGWTSEQLEQEIAAGAWYVVDALPGDAFTVAPDELWRAVLRRQRGPVAFAATYPADPELN